LITREGIYTGEVARLAPSAASRGLATRAWDILEARLGSDARRAHLALDNETFLARIREVRRDLGADDAWIDACRAVMHEAGVAPEESAVDVPRLRAVVPGSHRLRAAAPMYLAHRDTWYANPRAQINWWIPLHDIAPDEGFTIFLRALGVAVDNDSERFDYPKWRAEVGWQRPHAPADAAYPGARGELDGRDAILVAGPRASVTVFAGAHLHRTNPIDGDLIRFSLDFRTVHLADHHAGRGAPCVDDRSRGSTLADFALPSTWLGAIG
jgi:hypothetical protein